MAPLRLVTEAKKNSQLEELWMYKVDESKCTGCGTCVDTCPNEAIALVAEKAKIDPDECLECGSCEGECANQAIFEE